MVGDNHESYSHIDTCREGSLNMALDSLLLQQLREEEQVFLRFYTWCPATVSIGLFQKWQQQQQHSPYPWFGVLPVESCSSFARCELLICWTS